jgi:hypothetical protein
MLALMKGGVLYKWYLRIVALGIKLKLQQTYWYLRKGLDPKHPDTIPVQWCGSFIFEKLQDDHI